MSTPKIFLILSFASASNHPQNFYSLSRIFLEIRCEAPRSLKNGQVRLPEDGGEGGRSLRVAEAVWFSCEAGYELDGVERLDCLEDGTWSDIPPICQPVPCTQPPL